MLSVEYRNIADLVPYERNARTHSDSQIAQIAASIEAFGWTNPVLVDDSGGIIAGHGRLMAATSLGHEQVPTICIPGLSDAQRRALVIADNKLALNAGWDEMILAAELDTLRDVGFDATLIGFTQDELNALVGTPNTGPVGGEDAVPEIQPEPVSQPGDIWLLGKHRVMCGDSTSVDAVDLLMDGGRADMVLTDPPYGMHLDADFSGIKGSLKSAGRKNGIKGKKYADVIGDHEDFTPDLINSIFANFGYCDEIFLFGADYFAELLPGKNAGSWLVWDKRKEGQEDAIGAEFELLWSRQKHKRRVLRHEWFGFVSSKNALEARNREHPTQKPTTLLVDILEQWGELGDVVSDLYGGSGTLVVAAEKTGRHGRLMEIDPKYVDVIVRRWQTFTGKTATLKSSGQTFTELSDERLAVAA